MVYDVTYQVSGEERTDRVIAPHAAGAAERVQASHEADDGAYELLRVQLLDEAEAQVAGGAVSR
jgi:hypothetical protein